MPESVLSEPKKAIKSVFVLVPKTAEEKEFVYVIDEDKAKRDKDGIADLTANKKLPGGGASQDRDVSVSAQAEVFEETGLVIHPPARKIVEIHKVDDTSGNPHHWIAMKSAPPISCDLLARKQEEARRVEPDDRPIIENEIEQIRKDWPLEAGSEILHAQWESRECIQEAVMVRKFFRDHGIAFKWYFSGRSSAALDDILLDKRIISYFVDEDGCLVLCYDPNCEVCEREEETVTVVEPAEETMATYFPQNGNGAAQKTYSTILNVRETRMKPVLPEDQRVMGEVEVMFVSSDGRQDTLHLLPDFHSFSNPQDRYPNAVRPCIVSRDTSSITVAELASMFDVTAEWQVTILKPNGASVLVFYRGKRRPSHPRHGATFIPFSLNAPPPYDILISFDQIKSVLEAVDRFNRMHPSRTIWMHERWVSAILAKIKFKASLKKQEAVERRDRSLASVPA